MFRDLDPLDRVLVLTALREFAKRSAERAEIFAKTLPRNARFVQMERDDAARALEMVESARGNQCS